eukprot:8607821-Alexandrium_andersonii.AAC.1
MLMVAPINAGRQGHGPGRERGLAESTSASNGVLERPARVARSSVPRAGGLHVARPEGRARAESSVHGSRRGH